MATLSAKTSLSSGAIVTTSSDLEREIIRLTEGSPHYFRSIIMKMANANLQNAKALCKFISSETSERNLHKWIGTYNTRQMVICKFSRWLCNYHTEPDSNKWITPPCIQGIRQLPRKEKSPYKPSDMWTNEEHAIFLRYCPEKRDRCYHSVANDTSARPHELLSLRIKDIKFKLADSTGKQYAEVHLVESKNKPRTVPLIFSLPYVKDWIESHPKGIDQNAFLFPSLADYNFGDQLSENALYKQYTRTYRCSKFAP